MFRKIAFVALLIALVATAPVCPSTGCYFSKNNLILNGGFENPRVTNWALFSTIQGWTSEITPM
jgi:hypothetical protein